MGPSSPSHHKGNHECRQGLVPISEHSFLFLFFVFNRQDRMESALQGLQQRPWSPHRCVQRKGAGIVGTGHSGSGGTQGTEDFQSKIPDSVCLCQGRVFPVASLAPAYKKLYKFKSPRFIETKRVKRNDSQSRFCLINILGERTRVFRDEKKKKIAPRLGCASKPDLVTS